MYHRGETIARGTELATLEVRADLLPYLWCTVGMLTITRPPFRRISEALLMEQSILRCIERSELSISILCKLLTVNTTA